MHTHSQLALRFALAMIAAGSLHSAARAQDAFPIGAISYFEAAACPAGWVRYSPAEGRTLTPLPEEGLPGAQVGQALLPGEAPQHGHVAVGGITNASFHIKEGNAADPNRALDASNPSTVAFREPAGQTESGIPTVRFLACRKTAEPIEAELPAGLIAWFEQSECPAGWSADDGIRGRFLLGAPPDGAPGERLGRSAALSDQEDPTHTHRFDGEFEVPPYRFYTRGTQRCNPIFAGPGCRGPYAQPGRIRYTGAMEPASSGIPYIQLLACSKDGPPAPVVSAVVDATDFSPRPLAAGQLATVFGENLGPAEGVGAEIGADGLVSSHRGWIRVIFDEVEAPLFYVGSGQINVQIPYEVAGRPTVSVKVVRDDGTESEAFVLDLAPAAPAFFLHAGEKQAIAVFADGGLNSEQRPAQEGDALVLFATGGGALAPAEATGAPATEPFGKPVLPYRITIGGEQAVIDYFGAAPGFVGLLQANVRMTAAQGQASIVLEVGEAASDSSVYVFAGQPQPLQAVAPPQLEPAPAVQP